MKASSKSVPARPVKKAAAARSAKPVEKKQKPNVQNSLKTNKRTGKKITLPSAAKTKRPASKKNGVIKKLVSRAVEKLKHVIRPNEKAEIKGKLKATQSSPKLLTSGRMEDVRTRYSDTELVEFKQLIKEKLEASRKELKYLQDQINRTGDNGTDDTENKFASSDDGSSSMEREYLNQMAARQILYIDHLDKALIRIQNKTYGICRVTGKLIEKDRLKAVPHATLSMEAKMMKSHT